MLWQRMWWIHCVKNLEHRQDREHLRFGMLIPKCCSNLSFWSIKILIYLFKQLLSRKTAKKIMGLRGLELTTSWSSSQPSNHWAKVTSWQVSANFAIRVKIKSMAWFIHCVVLKIELLCLGLGHGHDCCLRHRLSHHLLANTASLFTMARKTLFAFTLTNDNWRIWFLDLSFSLFNNKRHSRSSKTFKNLNLKI